MSLQDPNKLLSQFWEHMSQLQNASRELSPSEQHQMADKLTEVYNYVSEQTNDRSNAVRAMYAQSAQAQKLRDTLASDREQLEKHEQFVTSNFERADTYLKTIQLAGYAVFFAAWGFTQDTMGPNAGAWSALLMIVSAVIFVGWEIFKVSLLSILLRKHANLGTSQVEQFVISRSSQFSSESSAILWFSSVRVWVWFACIIPAVIAVIILLIGIIGHLWS